MATASTTTRPIEAIDDDPEGTGWITESYEAGLAGAPKTGVGFILETGEPVAPAELTLLTEGAGWTFDVYGADGNSAPEDPPIDAEGAETGAWGDPLATDQTADQQEVSVELSTAVENRFFLIWITDLGNSETAEINDAQLLG